MYRVAESVARILMTKMNIPEIESTGPGIFTAKSNKSIGLIDPMCAMGTDFLYSLECPKLIFYPELPFNAPTIKAYFLYKREELATIKEPWEITRVFVDPNATDYEEQIEVSDCSIALPNDIEKLTCKTINTIEQLIKVEPLILDCVNLDRR